MKKLRRLSHLQQDNDMFEENDGLAPKKKQFVEPREWTIISALDRVLELSHYSELSNEFWQSAEKPLSYLREKLQLTNMQIVLVAIMAESGEPLSWRKFGNYVNCSRLAMMCHSEEIEGLLSKRWVIRRGSHEMGGCFEGFALEHGVVTALRHNEVFVPEKIDGFDEQQFMDKLESHIDKNLNNRNANFEDDEVWMMQLVNANPHLPICHEIMRFDNIHDKSLLLMIAFDYAQWADSDDEGLTLSSIDNIYPEDWECNGLRHELQNGTHILMKAGLIEQKCEDGIANTERYMLTQKAKTDLLSAYEPSRSKCRPRHNKDKSLTSFTEIKEKPLFYNPFEEDQIAQLTSLLSPENLSGIQHRLEEEGMRKGVACLFYGAPGTGKTETVLQIARRTGRNIMQIDIAGLRDKYVGESEKNIKSIFTRYKRLCKNSDILPILFFNEADGILTKRTSLTSSNPSIEKMENAIQNIILQEMENLEGILIATTNLTCNLDTAFERRFLFKIEFKKPETEVKAKIWKSMLRSISNEDAQILAERYDFSGGQIENVARKRAVNYVLYGKDATLDEIEKYCKSEQLDKKNERTRIGFIM